VVVLKLAQLAGLVPEMKPLQKETVISWYPVNLLFIVMLTSGSYAYVFPHLALNHTPDKVLSRIKFLSLPMVTIFKNFTTTLVAFGDYFFFHQSLTIGILASILLMVHYNRIYFLLTTELRSLQVASSVVAGLNDLEFNIVGYRWMVLNCIVSAGYVVSRFLD